MIEELVFVGVVFFHRFAEIHSGCVDSQLGGEVASYLAEVGEELDSYGAGATELAEVFEGFEVVGQGFGGGGVGMAQAQSGIAEQSGFFGID